MDLEKVGIDVATIFVECGLAQTKNEVRRMIKQNGVSVGNIRISDPFARLALIPGHKKFMIIEKKPLDKRL